MQLTEQETNVIKDLQTQEKACVDKYRFYEQSAHDEELKNLFHRIGDEEQEHFDSLGMVLKGDVPNVSAPAAVWRDTRLPKVTQQITTPKRKNMTNFYVPIVLQQKNSFHPPIMMMFSVFLPAISEDS